MNSTSLSLVYRPATAAFAAAVSTLALALVACAGSATTTTIDATEVADGGSSGTVGAKKDASASTPPPKVATAASACTDYAKARCAKDKSCNAFLFGATWGDDATCEARLELGCADKLAEPGVTWKPDGLATCADALSSASCDDLALGVLPSSCTPTAGTLDAKAACAHDEQCSTGLCKKGSFGACGSCAERAKEGGYCSSGSDCVAGLVCANSSCRAPAKQGESCYSGKPCVPGLVCDGGSCAKGAPAGSACGESPSSPDLCDHASGVFCSALLMSCTAAKVAPIGASCNAYTDLCAAGGTCDGFGSGGQCLAPPQEGDSCTVSGSGAGCFAPAVCDKGKCVVPSASACK